LGNGEGYGKQMSEPSREQRLNHAFVMLADTLVAGYDVVDLMHYLVDISVELLDASAAGIVLADGWHRLDVLAASSEESELLEVLQLQGGQGPCMDCFSTGTVQTIPDLTLMVDRWPHFAPLAIEQGVRSVHAVPMRLRDQTIGALNLFRSGTGVLVLRDRQTAQALADVATIGILQERAVRENTDLNERLEHALNSRVLIEQAKGVLANYGAVTMDQAFNTMRSYAASNGVPLTHLAQDLVDRRMRPAQIFGKRHTEGAEVTRPGAKGRRPVGGFTPPV
jgi:transcriptional regulator with GAF, ATPase, and Fis domain